MKKYTIKGNGTEEYGKHIIDFFQKLGAKNTHRIDGSSRLHYYYINDRNEINIIKTSIGTPDNHTEIKLLPNGMANGVWYKDELGNYAKFTENKTYQSIIGKQFTKTNIAFTNPYYKTLTPLTDLTEIQEFLPDGHEDKYKPEPTDSIKPSTEDILKLIYEKWGYDKLKNAIFHAIGISNYLELDGKNLKEKAENLIQKWQPKPKMWVEDKVIMISTDAPEGAVEYTQERLNGLLKLTK